MSCLVDFFPPILTSLKAMSGTSGLISAAHLYASGDIIIQNPVNSCIIFVSAILVSAVLEFGVRFVHTSVENKYVKTVVDVVTQEVTIVGVVALLIMLAQSALPEDPSYTIYGTIFSLANICLFLMATQFVLFVVGQFAVGTFDFTRWKRFEEGRMDAEEVQALRFREQRYKLAAERYAKELLRVYSIPVRECPFYEASGVVYKKLLVKLSNLSFRVWLAMSVVVLANFGRAMLVPWSATDDMSDMKKFINGLLYIGSTGYLTMLVFLAFCLHLRSKFNGLLEGQYPVLSTVGSDLVLFGNPMHCIELIQCVVMSMNYYMTLFVTGIVQTIPGTYQIAAIFIFLAPYVVTALLCFWAVWVLSIMSILGGLHKNRPLVQRVVRQLRGDADVHSDSSESDAADDDFSDDEALAALDDKPAPATNPSSTTGSKTGSKEKAPKKGGRTKRAMSIKGVEKIAAADDQLAAPRPQWLDPDDYWDGTGTVPNGGANEVAVVDNVFYGNVDAREFQCVLRQQAPHLAENADDERRRGADDDVKDRVCRDGKKRPIWLDSDEELDERVL